MQWLNVGICAVCSKRLGQSVVSSSKALKRLGHYVSSLTVFSIILLLLELFVTYWKEIIIWRIKEKWYFLFNCSMSFFLFYGRLGWVCLLCIIPYCWPESQLCGKYWAKEWPLTKNQNAIQPGMIRGEHLCSCTAFKKLCKFYVAQKLLYSRLT